jgi:hypothetical protein
MFYAELHQSTRITSSLLKVQPESFYPLSILFMRYDRHFMLLPLQSNSQRDVGLYISSRANSETNKMQRFDLNEEILLELNHFGHSKDMAHRKIQTRPKWRKFDFDS